MNKNLLKNKTFLSAIAAALLAVAGGVATQAGDQPPVALPQFGPGQLCPCDGVVMAPPVACPVCPESIDQPCDATSAGDSAND